VRLWIAGRSHAARVTGRRLIEPVRIDADRLLFARQIGAVTISSDMRREKAFDLLYGALRIFHNGLFIIVVMLMGYCAGWMLTGVSGIFLAWAVSAALHTDLSPEFVSGFSVLGKVVGVITGLWFAISILKR
jgi:hypothetical protein